MTPWTFLPRTARAFALAGLSFGFAASAQGQALQLQLHGEARCPSPHETRWALRRDWPELDTREAAPARLSVDLWSSGSTLTVVWHDGSYVHRRRLNARGSRCYELAQAVALLVRTWSEGLPQVSVVDPSDGTAAFQLPDTPPPEPPGAATSEPLSAEPPQAPPSAESLSPPPLVFSPVLPPAHPAPAPPSAPQPPPEPEHERPATAPVHGPRRLSILVSAGGAFGGTAQTSDGIEGSAAVDFAFESHPRLHAILQGTLENTLTQSLPTEGRVSISRTAVAALAAVDLYRTETVTLDACAGPRVDIWGASTTGVTNPRSRNIGVPGLVVCGRARADIGLRLYAFVSVEGFVQATPSFQVVGAATVNPSYVYANAEGGLGLWIW